MRNIHTHTFCDAFSVDHLFHYNTDAMRFETRFQLFRVNYVENYFEFETMPKFMVQNFIFIFIFFFTPKIEFQHWMDPFHLGCENLCDLSRTKNVIWPRVEHCVVF